MAQLQGKDSVLKEEEEEEEEEESTNFIFGNLIGGNINVLIPLSGESRRSLLMTQPPPPIPIPIPKQEKTKKLKKSSKCKTNWILCTKLKTDALGMMNNNNAAAPSSLARLLEIERRRHHEASSNNHQRQRQRQSLHIKYTTTWSCGGYDFTKFLPASGKRCCLVQEEEDDDYVTPLLLSSCLCGDPKTH